MSVSIKTESDLVGLRVAGRLAADVLAMIASHVKPGISTQALDDICNDYIVNELKVIPANVGYHGFTKTTCISPNTVVCHGIPCAEDILKEGDIVNIDVAVIKDGWHGDTSRMYYVGQVSPLARRLVETTYEATLAGIHAV
ncbi:MAG TPA: M24 family metallopeptidase, partial [Pseudomonas sp.]|nr:M24 family metallopeptidase [Pseudomonas sp.]